MLILFLVDTSFSMIQKAQSGLSMLDICKSGIEYFIKIRNRDPAAKSDRYFLVSCENSPNCVKSGWKDNFSNFTNELKNLEAKSLTEIGPALAESFSLLNQYRLQTNIDNYGQGMYPYFYEPSVIIVLTDGGQFTSLDGVQETLTLPNLASNMSSQLTKEPFRWDQRVFSITLKFPSVPHNEIPKNEATVLDPLCEVTGGFSKIVSNMKGLMQTMEEICISKLKTGVIVNFEPISFTTKGPTNIPPQKLRAYHKMIFVKSNNGFWPIPENYLPTSTMTNLPQRAAQPIIHMLPSERELFVLDKFPYDSYEIESCNLTNYVLETQTTFLTYVQNSKGSSGFGDPFGFIKAKEKSVFFYVFPYNFPRLFTLLDELITFHKFIPTQNWRQEFERYLYSLPNYYIQPLKVALKRLPLPLPNIIPDNLDGALNYSINSYLKKLKKKTKLENDMIAASQKSNSNSNQKVIIKNPFDIERHQLIEQLDLMQSSVFQIDRKFDSNADKFSVPISEMGNFNNVCFKKEKLRNPYSFDEDIQPISFGSPFRKEKKQKSNLNNLSVDESEDEMNFLKKDKKVDIIEIKDNNEKESKKENISSKLDKENSEPDFVSSIPNWKNIPKTIKSEIISRIQFQQFENDNFELKKQLKREIKLPKNDENSIQKFSKNLKSLKGSISQKRKFVEKITEDVKYFKKKKLEIEIDKFSKELK
eukprot:gene4695-8267_t